MNAIKTTCKPILLVEDSSGQCELMSQALAYHGLQHLLQIEQDAEAALTLLHHRAALGPEECPQVILMDIKLAYGSGLDLLRGIRAHPRLRFVPVLILTTSDDPHDMTASYASGANGYIVKPGTFSDLVKLSGDLCHFWLHWNRVPDPC